MAPPRKQHPQPLPTTLGSVEVEVGPVTTIDSEPIYVDPVTAEPVGSEEPPADIGPYPEVSMQEAIPAPKCTAWKVVEELSDDEFQVEVANIDGYQMRKCILRFRINGQLSPLVRVMDQIRYHGEKGFQNR